MLSNFKCEGSFEISNIRVLDSLQEIVDETPNEAGQIKIILVKKNVSPFVSDKDAPSSGKSIPSLQPRRKKNCKCLDLIFEGSK